MPAGNSVLQSNRRQLKNKANFHCSKSAMIAINPFNAYCCQTSQTILIKIDGKCINRKIVDGEMLIRTLPTTFLQISCKILLHSKVILLSIIDPGVILRVNGLSKLSFNLIIYSKMITYF